MSLRRGEVIWRLMSRLTRTETATHTRVQIRLAVYSSRTVRAVNNLGWRSTRYSPVGSWQATV